MPKLRIKILEDKQSLGRTTAEHAARSLRVAIRDRGLARIIAGASQFEFLEALTRAPDIDWAKVELFHLDEWWACRSHIQPVFASTSSNS